MRLLIIGSCTKDKDYNGTRNRPLGLVVPTDYPDFDNTSIMSVLTTYCKNAGDLYRGKAHIKIKEAVDQLKRKGVNVDYCIISAGYGLIELNQEIIPYDITFQGKRPTTIISASNALQIPQNVQEKISSYDAIIFALAHDYLISIQFDIIAGLNEKKLVFIDSQSSYSKNEDIYQSLKKQKCNVNNWLVINPRSHGGPTPFRGYILKEIAGKISSKEDFDKEIKNQKFV